MKGNRLGVAVKAVAISVATGLLGLTACSRDYTVGYLYVTSATRTNQGSINAYSIDYQSGALQQLADSPIPSGGSNPVSLVASPNGKYLYVLNNQTSTVVQFDIGTDGKLYAENTYSVVQGAGSVTGTFPTAAAIDAAGANLYVTFTYQNGFTTATPGPGGLAVFPIKADGSLSPALVNTTVGTTAGAPLPYYPLGFSPVGVVTSAYNNFVYVVEQDTSTRNGVVTQTGTILAFAAKAGSLTPVPGTIPVTGSTLTGFRAGTKPSAIAEDPSARFVYVTDQLTNQLYAYSVGTNGALNSIASSPFATGNFPLGLTIDPRGSFVYVVNFGDSTLTSYAINTATGALSGVSGTTGAQVSTGPTCVTIEPALGVYLYTSNNTDGTVSAAKIQPNTGSTESVQGTPYPTSPLPTCAVTVANGAHATQLVTP